MRRPLDSDPSHSCYVGKSLHDGWWSPPPVTTPTGYSYIPPVAHPEVFAAWREGETMVHLSKRYDVSRATISKIVHRLLNQEHDGTIRE